MAAVSLATYSYMYSWKFAVLIMVSLFVHESGHVWAMKKCGMRIKGIFFIPLMGGAAVTDSSFKTRGEEVFVALMGPVWGLLLALATVIPYFLTKNPLFAAAASWMAMVNLFNLLPINPLDGGRVFKSVAFSINSNAGKLVLIGSILASIFLAYKTHLGLFAFLAVICFIEASIDQFLRYKYVKKKLSKFKNQVQAPYFYDRVLSPLYNKSNPSDFSRVKSHFGTDFDEKNTVSIPKLTPPRLAISVLCYFLLIGSLWALMHYTSTVPGAALAMEILK